MYDLDAMSFGDEQKLLNIILSKMKITSLQLTFYLAVLLYLTSCSAANKQHGSQRSDKGHKKSVMTDLLTFHPLKQAWEQRKPEASLTSVAGKMNDSILRGGNKRMPKVMIVMPKTGDMISLKTFHRLHPKDGSVTPLYREDKQGRRVYFLPVAKKMDGNPAYVLAKNLLTMTKHTVDKFLGEHQLTESPSGGINIEKFTDSSSPGSKEKVRDTVFDDNLDENSEKGRLMNATKGSEKIQAAKARTEEKAEDVDNHEDEFETVSSFTKPTGDDEGVGAKRSFKMKEHMTKVGKDHKGSKSELSDDLVDDFDYVGVDGSTPKIEKAGYNIGDVNNFVKLRNGSKNVQNMSGVFSFHKQPKDEGFDLAGDEVFEEVGDDTDEDEDEKEDSQFKKLNQQPGQSSGSKKSNQMAGLKHQKTGQIIEVDHTSKNHLQESTISGDKMNGQESVKSFGQTVSSQNLNKSIRQEFVGNLGQKAEFKVNPEAIQPRQSLVQQSVFKPKSSLQVQMKEGVKKVSMTAHQNTNTSNSQSVQHPVTATQQTFRYQQTYSSNIKLPKPLPSKANHYSVKTQQKLTANGIQIPKNVPSMSTRFWPNSMVHQNKQPKVAPVASTNNKATKYNPIKKLAKGKGKLPKLESPKNQKPKAILQPHQNHTQNPQLGQQTKNFQKLLQNYQHNQNLSQSYYPSVNNQAVNQYYQNFQQQKSNTIQNYQQNQNIVQKYQPPANKTNLSLEPNITAFALVNLMKNVTNVALNKGTKLNNSTSTDILTLPLQQPFANNKENQALINQFAKMFRQGLPLNNKRPKATESFGLNSAYQSQYASQYNQQQYPSNFNYAAYTSSTANQPQQLDVGSASSSLTPESQYPDLQAYAKQSESLSQYDANAVNSFSSVNQNTPKGGLNQLHSFGAGQGTDASAFTNTETPLSQSPLSDQYAQSDLTQNAAYPSQDSSISSQAQDNQQSFISNENTAPASVLGDEYKKPDNTDNLDATPSFTGANTDQSSDSTSEFPGNSLANNAADTPVESSNPDSTSPNAALSEYAQSSPVQPTNNFPVAFYPQQPDNSLPQKYSESDGFARNTRGQNTSRVTSPHQNKLQNQVSAANTVQRQTSNIDQDGFLTSNDVRYPSPAFRVSSPQKEFLQSANKAMAAVLDAKSSTENFIQNMNKKAQEPRAHAPGANTANIQQTVQQQQPIVNTITHNYQQNTNINPVVQTQRVATNYASNPNYYDSQKDYEPAALDAYLAPSTANYFDSYFTHNGIPDQRHHAKAYSFLHSFLRHVKSITNDPDFWKTQQPVQADTKTGTFALKRDDIAEPILEGRGNVRDHVEGRILSEPKYLLGDAGDVKNLLHGSGFNNFNDEDMKLLFGSPITKKAETRTSKQPRKATDSSKRQKSSPTKHQKKNEILTSSTLPVFASTLPEDQMTSSSMIHDEPAFLTLLLPEDDGKISTRGVKRSSTHRRKNSPSSRHSQERFYAPTRSLITSKKVKAIDLKALEFNGTEND